jgi:hypothetical protein
MPAPDPAAPFRAPLRRFPISRNLFAFDPRHELRVQVRLTAGFWAPAMFVSKELNENQWVVLSAQHYYTREL